MARASTDAYEQKLIRASYDAIERSRELIALSDHLVTRERQRPNTTFLDIRDGIEALEAEHGEPTGKARPLQR